MFCGDLEYDFEILVVKMFFKIRIQTFNHGECGKFFIQI